MCFSLDWIAKLLIFAIIIIAVFAILKLIVPFVLSKLGVGMASEIVGLFIQIFTIAIWAVVLIFCVIVAFDIIACLLSYAGGFPSLRH